MSTKREPTTVGIFIPTMNRVDFVIRQLRYYASVQCPHTIYVGDSSPKSESDKIKNEIDRLGNAIKVKYYYLPNYNDWQAHYHLIAEVKENYICYSGDDDYQIPNSLTKCAEFLENNPDYISASGKAVSFRLKQDGVYGNLNRLADYPRQQIEDDSASDRIINFFNNYYVTHFSVNRTKDVLESWQNADIVKDRSFRSEILPTSIPIIRGKSKIIDCLGFVRQIHNRRYLLPNVFDWLTDKNWNESFTLTVDRLSNELTKKDKISKNEAIEVMRRAIWAYLNKQLVKEYSTIYPGEASKTTYFKTIKTYLGHRLPFLKKIYKNKLNLSASKKEQLHYEVIQNGSKYFKDFEPVMNSFSGNNQEKFI